MASFNKVILLGNLTRDPELKFTPSGTAVASFALAVNRTWIDQAGQKKEEVTYIDVTAFGKQAETIGKHMTKGRQFFVEGRLKLDQWEKNGEKRSRLSVVLEEFQFVGGRPGGDQAPAAGYDSAPPARPVARAPAAPRNDFADDDSVPF